MHGVGQPPMVGIDTSDFSYLRDAHIPYSRLHDVGGWFGGNMFVDIPNVFRNFDADVNDPASYDFTFTDLLLNALVENGIEPYYRLGVTIENFHEKKAYRIFPPRDFRKWAEICEHIIRHYNEGWADGFHLGITYWEIWCEPDGHHDVKQNALWKGTPEQYFELYKTTSLHLRKCFGDSIKIGGYGSCGFYAALREQTISGEAFGVKEALSDWDHRIMGFIRFFKSFLEFVKREELPFDFFSHHSYEGVKNNLIMQTYCEEMLDQYGFHDTEIHLNEWNTDPHTGQFGTSKPCADAVALMCEMQNTRMNVMCFYDARMRQPSDYGGMFDAGTREPFTLYYGFRAFGELFCMGTQTEAKSDNEDIYVLSAAGGGRKGILISNIGNADTVSVSGAKVKKAYLIDENHHFTGTEIDENAIELAQYGVIYMECE